MKVGTDILMTSHGNNSDTQTSWATFPSPRLEREGRRPLRLSTFIKAKDDALQMGTYIKHERRTASQVTRAEAEEEKKRINEEEKKG